MTRAHDGDRLYTEFVERGYNNRAAVPDHPRGSRATRERSAGRARALGRCATCATAPDRKETLDLFVPPGRRAARSCSSTAATGARSTRATSRSSRSPFVAQGIAVAVVNYDLCPDGDDRRRSSTSAGARSAWVVREGARHGAARSSVVVGGHSAGGHLAAMLLATDWTALRPRARPRCAGGVSLSGVHDLAPLVLVSFNADFRLDDAEAARRVAGRTCAPRARAPLLIGVRRRRDVRIPAADAAPVGRVAGESRRPEAGAAVRSRRRPLQRRRRLRRRRRAR